MDSPRSPNAPPQRAPNTRALRVLVVEDDADLSEMTVELLTLYGHTVESAADGPGALATATRGDFDVVLLDLSLPGFSGLEVARLLRASPAGARPYIIAMSGYSREEDVARATEAGCDTYLVKPVEFDRLQSLLAARGA
jgi:CheY-like chemotaxis protein